MINPTRPIEKKPLLTRNRVLVVAGLLAAVALTFYFLRPPLSPEQQLRRDMDGLQSAVESTSPRGVLAYVADDFKWNDTNRDGLSKLLKGAFIEATQVKAKRTAETYEIRGDSATVSGIFNARYRRIRESHDAPMNTLAGDYSLIWQRRDGDWKIVGASGGDKTLDKANTSESLF